MQTRSVQRGMVEFGRPGLDPWDSKGPFAVDLFVHHPLAPGACLQLLACLRHSLGGKVPKHRNTVRDNAKRQYTPLAFHSFGGIAPKGIYLLRSLFPTPLQNTPIFLESLRVIRTKLFLCLMKHITQKLMAILPAETSKSQGSAVNSMNVDQQQACGL